MVTVRTCDVSSALNSGESLFRWQGLVGRKGGVLSYVRKARRSYPQWQISRRIMEKVRNCDQI